MATGSGWVATVIDVSKWQSSLPSLVGVSGVIARAGIGTKPDSMFATHIANARRTGKWVGSYWYNWGDLSVSAQVDAYIAREAAVGGVSLHVIDWEGAEGFTAAQTADFIRIYKARTGNLIGLYASEGRYRDLGQDWRWIANYSNEPSKTYDMWQYGPFRGVDGNHARQRVLDIAKATVGDSMAQLAITNTTPMNIVIAKGSRRRDLDGGHDGYVFDAEYRRFSPYGVTLSGQPLRAFYASVDGDTELRLVTAASATPIVVAPDASPYTQADIDAAVTAAESPLRASLTAAEGIIEAQKAALLATAEFKAAHDKLFG